MCRHEWRSRLEPAVEFANRARPFPGLPKLQRQKAGGGVEWTVDA